MNKHGITLVEVIISVGLISVVMLFLFNLLLDMQYENSHASYLKENQINRANIIKTVEEDLMNNNLETINISVGSSSSTVVFEFETFSTTLTVMEDRVSYKDETWLLETNGNDEAYYDFKNIKKVESSSDTCSYILNVDSDGDGVCDYNCDTNRDGILNEEDSTTINDSFQSCSLYKSVRLIIPAVTGADENVIDDLEFYYIGLK